MRYAVLKIQISNQSSLPTHHPQIRDSLDYNKVNGATDSIDSQPEVKGNSWHGWKFEPNLSLQIGKCITDHRDHNSDRRGQTPTTYSLHAGQSAGRRGSGH
jgi:hypothetical protein